MLSKLINLLCLALICGLFVDNGLTAVISSRGSDKVDSISGRIVGGRDAELGEFPYQVSLQILYVGHFCGGAILHQYYIISAAHCTTGILVNSIIVRAGAYNILLAEVQTQRTTVAEHWVHPNYTGGIAPHDIALFRVTTPFVFDQYVQPIRLPPSGFFPSGVGTVTGWGSISGTGVMVSPILQVADLPVIEWTECNELLRSYGANYLGLTNFCTGPLSGGLSTCSGDSGGPLVQYDYYGEFMLVGLVSWGFVPCGLRNRPQVFVNVGDYIEWINQTPI